MLLDKIKNVFIKMSTKILRNLANEILKDAYI